YKHVTVRKNAEESAFFDAAEFEEYECNRFLSRIAELIRHMRCINSVESIDWSESTDQEDSPNLLVTENLSYSTPGKLEELVSDLSLKVPKNKTLLITGTSGVGKTSFMRNSMFVPQRPYLPPGQLSLRQQIVFPMIDDQPDSKCIAFPLMT
ncbi:hypothetical protein ANCDUO_12905, partial [Ancylostoma duodenale]